MAHTCSRATGVDRAEESRTFHILCEHNGQLSFPVGLGLARRADELQSDQDAIRYLWNDPRLSCRDLLVTTRHADRKEHIAVTSQRDGHGLGRA